MLRLVKTLEKNGDKTQASYIRMLMVRGKIKQYKSKDGFIAYETTEYREYRKNAKVGRPKLNKEI